jgi:hypothetical protein
MHKEKYKNVYERFLNVFFMGVLGYFEMGVGTLVILDHVSFGRLVIF